MIKTNQAKLVIWFKIGKLCYKILRMIQKNGLFTHLIVENASRPHIDIMMHERFWTITDFSTGFIQVVEAQYVPTNWQSLWTETLAWKANSTGTIFFLIHDFSTLQFLSSEEALKGDVSVLWRIIDICNIVRVKRPSKKNGV